MAHARWCSCCAGIPVVATRLQGAGREVGESGQRLPARLPVPALRARDWTGRRWFLRANRNGKLHCAIDRDSSNTFPFIHPRIRIQFLGRSIARRFNFFLRASARFFVVVAVGGGPRQTRKFQKERREKRSKPREQWSALPGMAKSRRPCQFLKRSDSIRRGSRTGKREVRQFADKGKRGCTDGDGQKENPRC